MAETRVVALTRLVSMIDYIYRNPGISVKELASQFGRRPHQVKADIETLGGAGFADLLPGSTLEIDWELYDQEGRLKLFSPLEITSPIALTGEEVSRVIVGLQTISPTLSEDERRQVPGMISALLSAPEASPLGGAVQTVAPTIDSELFALITDAIANPTILDLTYRNAAGEVSSRLVWPEELRLERDGWVFTAWCMAADGPRTFRVDRITDLQPGPAGQKRPPASRRNQAEDSSGQQVKVALTSDAAWVLGESVAKEVTASNSGVSAVYEVWDSNWLAAELISNAAYVKHTEPADCGLEVRDRARKALRVWREVLG